MRKCDNCSFGSYGLDCKTGIETLYCKESDYEHEVKQDDVCIQHQFIDGYENEKNYYFYDATYLGPGIFIINECNNEIIKYFKIYIMNDSSYPNYAIRAFSKEGKDLPDEEYNNIEFIFRNREDDELFNILSILSQNINGAITTIDELEQRKNHLSISSDKNIIKLTISKDIYGGKQHPSNFIDINLGDNDTCQNYYAINELYNSLIELCKQNIKEDDIYKIISLKKNI